KASPSPWRKSFLTRRPPEDCCFPSLRKMRTRPWRRFRPWDFPAGLWGESRSGGKQRCWSANRLKNRSEIFITTKGENGMKLDERGKQCPMPVIEAKRALETCKAGEIV